MIKVQNITKKYGNFVAVDDISFEIKKGEMRLLTHFPSYFLIYDCLCPHPFHEMKKDYRLLPLSALPPCPDG